MRTTLNLPDALMARLKAHARERGETVTSVVERAMRDALDAAEAERRAAVDLPDFPVLGLPASGHVVVLDDNQRLQDLLDEDDGTEGSEQRMLAELRAARESRRDPA